MLTTSAGVCQNKPSLHRGSVGSPVSLLFREAVQQQKIIARSHRCRVQLQCLHVSLSRFFEIARQVVGVPQIVVHPGFAWRRWGEETSIHDTIERIVGRNELPRLRVFYYPEEHPPLGWERIKAYWTLSKKLREELLATDFPTS